MGSISKPRWILGAVLLAALSLTSWRVRDWVGLSRHDREVDGPNLLTNGSFEAGLAGWSGAGFRVIPSGTGAYHGSQVLELDPGSDPEALRTGVLSAPLELEPERCYRVRIAMQTGFGSIWPRFAISLNEDALYHELCGLPPQHAAARVQPERDGWGRYEVTFFAERRENTLILGPLSRYQASIPWGKLWIDNVRVEALGITRKPGIDYDLRATLPANALVGEPVELALVHLGHRRAASGVNPAADRCKEDMLARSVSYTLTDEGGAAEIPDHVDFVDQARLVLSVRFDTPGVHRLALRSGDYAVRSNPVEVSVAAPERRTFFGDIHIHTGYGHADWYGGMPEQIYTFARDAADLDFAALTEHYGPATRKAWMEAMAPATQRFDEPERFATFLATETAGPHGHWNFYLGADDPLQMFEPSWFVARQAEACEYLHGLGAPFLCIPHHFMVLDPVDWRLSNRDDMRLAEIYSLHGSSEEAGSWWRHPLQAGPSYALSKGAPGHDYRTALARGQRLGVIACSDDHAGRPGLAGLTCVSAPRLERRALFDALHERRCYATTGARILLDFELAGAPQGSEIFLEPGAALGGRLTVHGSAPLEGVELLQDGQVLRRFEPGALDLDAPLDLGPFAGRPTYLQARVFQSDLHRAWSSPIWIDPHGVPDLALERKDMEYDWKSSTLAVRAHDYGDAPAHARLTLHSSLLDPRLADVDYVGVTAQSFFLRLEPVDDDHVRLKAVLDSPLTLRKKFRFSGSIEFLDAAGFQVLTDPRNMLKREGERLTWDDAYGVYFQNTQSLNGQLSDFEVLVSVRPGTRVFVAPLVDASPPLLVLGALRHPGSRIELDQLHGLATRTRVDQREFELAALGTTTLQFQVPPRATYLAVLDPSDELRELCENNNAWALRVTARSEVPPQWPEYASPAGAR